MFIDDACHTVRMASVRRHVRRYTHTYTHTKTHTPTHTQRHTPTHTHTSTQLTADLGRLSATNEACRPSSLGALYRHKLRQTNGRTRVWPTVSLPYCVRNRHLTTVSAYTFTVARATTRVTNININLFYML